MEFPKIGGTARNDIFFAKLAHDCLIQAQEHLPYAIKNREDADESYADLQYADQQISQTSETLIDYAHVVLDETPEAR